jgi:hypothetical protein
MNIPNEQNSEWIKLFSGQKTVKLKFLATKILLARLQREYKEDPNSIDKLILELKNFLEKNENITNVQEDIKQMFT